MKNYSFPAIVVVCLAIVCAFIGLYTFTVAQSARQVLQSKQVVLQGLQVQLQSSKDSVENAKKQSVPVESFIAGWRDQFNAADDLTQIFGRLDRSALDNLVSASEKKNTVTEGYAFAGKLEHVKTVSINVSSREYWRLLNWLGDVENTYPLARVEGLSFVISNNTLSMSTSVAFPSFEDFNSDKLVSK